MAITWEYDPIDDASYTLPFPAGSVVTINVGDLLYWDTVNLCVKPASALADLTTETLDQAAFGKLFCGVSAEKRRSTDEARPGVVVRRGFFNVDVPSGAYHFGSPLAPERDSVNNVLFSQTMDAATSLAAACAFVANEYPSGTTNVMAWFRVNPEIFTRSTVASLTDSTGGTAATTFAAITAGASYAQADMVAVKNALSQTVLSINAILTVLKNTGKIN